MINRVQQLSRLTAFFQCQPLQSSFSVSSKSFISLNRIIQQNQKQLNPSFQVFSSSHSKRTTSLTTRIRFCFSQSQSQSSRDILSNELKQLADKKGWNKPEILSLLQKIIEIDCKNHNHMASLMNIKKHWEIVRQNLSQNNPQYLRAINLRLSYISEMMNSENIKHVVDVLGQFHTELFALKQMMLFEKAKLIKKNGSEKDIELFIADILRQFETERKQANNQFICQGFRVIAKILSIFKKSQESAQYLVKWIKIFPTFIEDDNGYQQDNLYKYGQFMLMKGQFHQIKGNNQKAYNYYHHGIIALKNKYPLRLRLIYKKIIINKRNLYKNNGDYQNAIKYSKKIIEQQNKYCKLDTFVDLQTLFDSYWELKQIYYSKGLKDFKNQSLKGWIYKKNIKFTVETIDQFANIIVLEKQNEEALQFCELALKQVQQLSGTNCQEYANLLFKIASLTTSQKKKTKYYKQSMNIYIELKQNCTITDKQLDILLKISEISIYLGNISYAYELLTKMSKKETRGVKKAQIMKLKSQLVQQNSDQSLNQNINLLQIYQKIGGKLEECAQACLNIAEIYSNVGNVKAAVNYYIKAQQYYQKATFQNQNYKCIIKILRCNQIQECLSLDLLDYYQQKKIFVEQNGSIQEKIEIQQQKNQEQIIQQLPIRRKRSRSKVNHNKEAV